MLDTRERLVRAELEGPRLLVAGPYFTAPGGHPAATLLKGNDWAVAESCRQIDSADGARRAVGEIAARSVDWIKVVNDRGEGPLPTLSREVLGAIVDEAHRRRLRVAAHVHSWSGLREVVALGVDSVEHAGMEPEPLDDATLAEMAARGIAWVPTLRVQASLAAGADLGADDPEVAAVYRDLAAKLQVARPAVLASVRAAVARGVRIGAGTDSLGPALRYGPTLPAEVAAFVEAGLTPAQALRTATSSSAEILGLGDRIARLAAGMGADGSSSTVSPGRGRPTSPVSRSCSATGGSCSSGGDFVGVGSPVGARASAPLSARPRVQLGRPVAAVPTP